MSNPFLDLTADVDRDSSEDEDRPESEDEDFIDNDDPTPGGSNLAPPHSDPVAANDEAGMWDELLARAYQRGHEHVQHPSASLDAVAVPSLPVFGARLPTEPEEPNDEDYPLWRVRCRTGVEEQAIDSLLQLAETRHQLRSAFMRGSIRGWIYLEAVMNKDLQHLLHLTPGLGLRNGGSICELVPRSDWINTLKMQNPKITVENGQWVQILSGAYKGDVGLVDEYYNGVVEVYLVPRLKPVPLAAVRPSKRKRSTPPPAARLFDPSTCQALYGIVPRKVNQCYHARNLTFHSGLVLKKFDAHSVSHATSMPSHLFSLFKECGLQLLETLDFPRPQEWVFERGERVTIRSSRKVGFVCSSTSTHLEVDLISGEGRFAFPWREIQKLFTVGDFVRIMAGPLHGQTGWVARCDDDTIHIIDKNEGGVALHSDALKAIGTYEAHRNWLKAIDVEFLHAQTEAHSVEPLPKKTSVPWRGVKVIITKLRDELKGRGAVVMDVLAGQSTASGLKIDVGLASFDPTHPYQRVVFDHEDIVEETTKLKLLHFALPKDDAFAPPSDYFKRYGFPAPSSFGALMQPPPAPTPTNPFSTPLWDSSSHTSGPQTPAWDPSSRTPQWEPSDHIATADLLPSSQLHLIPETPQHPLFDRRLIGMEVKVTLNGGKYTNKETFVSIVETDGCVKVQHQVYGTTTNVEPGWITIKRPNSTRDNGLLGIIEGEHCGKYVRRIHHRPGDVMFLAVMERAEGVADRILDERLELGVESLAIVFESKDDKARNKTIMDSLRYEARNPL